jgi:hypothetical protein
MQWIKKLGENMKHIIQLETLSYMPYYREYLALGEEICAAFSFQSYYTLKYRSWPMDLDEHSLKSTWKKWMIDE